MINSEQITKAVKLLESSQIVAFPTETVYGLGGDAESDEAIAAIYTAKSRPIFNPLIVHVADKKMAEKYAVFTKTADKLYDAFCPGAITLVLRKRKNSPLSSFVGTDIDTVGIRIPANKHAKMLISEFGRGVAAPSANRSGRISPTSAQHVADEFDGQILQPAMILDGGSTEKGLESTVVWCADDTKPAVILRHGTLTFEAIQKILPNITMNESNIDDNKPSAPGMLSKHYSPKAKVRLNANYAQADEGLLAFGHENLTNAEHIFNLSPSGDLAEAAANLFAGLRELDKSGVTTIAVMPIPNEGIGVAINDRLQRAAVTDKNPRFITLQDDYIKENQLEAC